MTALGRRIPIQPPGNVEFHRDGYTACGNPVTATVDGVCGRRCADHPPRFQAERAVEMLVRGWPGAAMAYVRGTP